MPAQTVIAYVAQYQGNAGALAAGCAPGTWIDLSARATPEEAFERLDMFQASWGALNVQEAHFLGFRVVERVVTDTVITDPRLAPEAAEVAADA